MANNSISVIGQGSTEFQTTATTAVPPYPMLTDLQAIGSATSQAQPFRRMHQFWEAIRSGSCKVLFLGDSVTENVSQNHPMSHWTLSYQRELRRAFPWVTFTFVNLSIGGRQAKHVMGYLNTQPSSTPGAEYLSVTSNENNATNFLRAAGSGATQYVNPDTWPGAASGETQWGAGETWVSRLVKQNCDLVTLCFGLNEENGSTKAWFGQALQAIIDCVRSGSTFSTYKRPSFVMLTPYNDTIARDTRNQLSEQLRSVAAGNDIPVIDANRWDGILVEGVDHVRRRWSGEPYMRYIRESKTSGSLVATASNDKWWIPVGTPSTSGTKGFISKSSTDTGQPALKMIRRRAARDFQVGLRASSSSSGTVAENVISVWYRVDPTDHTKGYEVRYTGTGALELRYTNNAGSTSTLASASIYAFGSNSQAMALKVRVEGGLHQVWTAFGSTAPATGGDPQSYQLALSYRHSGSESDANDDITSKIMRSDGYCGVSLGSTGTAYPTFVYTQFNQQTTYLEFGDPMPVKGYGYTPFDLMNTVSDFICNLAPTDTNYDSPGGNAINHLKTDAYSLVYDCAIGAFMQQFWASRQDTEIIKSGGTAVTGTATTTEEILATIPVPKNFMARNGMLEVETLWTVTNSANNKTLRVRFGTVGITSQVCMANIVTTNATARYHLIIGNRNNDAAQVCHPSAQFSASGSAVTTATIDTAQDQNIYITAEKASAGETATLERYSVRLIGGAA